MKYLELYEDINFDWNEKDFDFEEEFKWVLLSDIINKSNYESNYYKSFIGKEVMISPDSSYYLNSYYLDAGNPKDTIGYITNIIYTENSNYHNINVNWSNGHHNVYRYQDLLIKI